jgi:hypothetical protein
MPPLVYNIKIWRGGETTMKKQIKISMNIFYALFLIFLFSAPAYADTSSTFSTTTGFSSPTTTNSSTTGSGTTSIQDSSTDNGAYVTGIGNSSGNLYVNVSPNTTAAELASAVKSTDGSVQSYSVVAPDGSTVTGTINTGDELIVTSSNGASATYPISLVATVIPSTTSTSATTANNANLTIQQAVNNATATLPNVSIQQATTYGKNKANDVIILLQNIGQPFAIVVFIIGAFITLFGSFGTSHLIGRGLWVMIVAIIIYAVIVSAPFIVNFTNGWLQSKT